MSAVQRESTPLALRLRTRAAAPPSLDLSVVVPVRDEIESLGALVERVHGVLGESRSWELVLVDDGSTDGSARSIRELARQHARVVGVVLERPCGQTAAIAAGIGVARGVLVATMDADLQNDPADLPALIAALGDNDAVVGYRVRRHDSLVRRISSRVAKAVRDLVSGDRVRDTGCSLKVFRAAAIEAIPLFEGMHRFLPTLLRYNGFRVIEHPVSHQPRRAGRSKYGIRNRAWRALLDLFAVRWMKRRRILLPLAEQPLPLPTQRAPAAKREPAACPSHRPRSPLVNSDGCVAGLEAVLDGAAAPPAASPSPAPCPRSPREDSSAADSDRLLAGRDR